MGCVDAEFGWDGWLEVILLHAGGEGSFGGGCRGGGVHGCVRGGWSSCCLVSVGGSVAVVVIVAIVVVVIVVAIVAAAIAVTIAILL